MIAVARASASLAALPEAQEGFAFTLLGLVGLADPLRASVPAAVAECRSAGIRVVMITGDYPATAAAIARQAGLDADVVVTGDDLETLSDQALAERARRATVFARIMPEQKLRIVSALKAEGAVVAMTGDGVNDAPSLKAAHIGIAMGGRGTDVARAASDITLVGGALSGVAAALDLSKATLRNVRQNLFLASVYNVVLIPVAAGALYPLSLIHISEPTRPY